jgi:hypothetical protein
LSISLAAQVGRVPSQIRRQAGGVGRQHYRVLVHVHRQCLVQQPRKALLLLGVQRDPHGD